MSVTTRFAYLAVLAGCLWGLPAGPAAAAEQMTPAMTRDIEKIVREYLRNNPEVVVEALEAFKKKREAAATAAMRKTLAEKKPEIRNDPSSPVGGNPQGDVVVVEFFDYRCGVCKRVHPFVTELVKTDKKIRMVYKEWPILGPESVFAARAALAAHRQDKDKYVAFHNIMMEATRPLNPSIVISLAAKVGLDVEQLRRDMTDPEIDAILRRNFELAEALMIKGTPSFIIGDEFVPGGRDLPTLRKIVANQRKSG